MILQLATRSSARSVLRTAPSRSVSTWSGNLSFASPESDFNTSGLSDTQSRDASTVAEWSNTISYASPMSDVSASRSLHTEVHNENPSFSNTYSFASPESDFTSPSPAEIEHGNEWSNELSFASPESDFVASSVRTDRVEEDREALRRVAQHPLLQEMLMTPESALGYVPLHHFMGKQHVEGLQVLPDTMEEALGDSRPIVVTEAKAPFHIVDVNDAWVGLCGFSKHEARNSSLRMIQGQDTDRGALNHIVGSLRQGQQASAVVMNYSKTGRKFLNQLHAGPLRDPITREVTHFVGILNEVSQESQHAAAY